MAKYSKKIVKKIVDMLRSDTYTITEVCHQVGITTKTYYEWLKDYEDFAEQVEQAQDERMQFFVAEAKKSLLKKIQGYTVDETKVVTVPGATVNGKVQPKIKEQTTVKKHIAPDTAAVIFTMTNGEPSKWRNRQYNEVRGKDGKDLFKQLTDEELEAKIQALESKMKD